MNIEISKRQKQFIDAYFTAIDFTESERGSELCEVFSEESVIDCLAFFNKFDCFLSCASIEQAGHDFWLSRNGHGTGFWDRDETVYKNWLKHKMQAFAEAFGEVHAIFDDEV